MQNKAAEFQFGNIYIYKSKSLHKEQCVYSPVTFDWTSAYVNSHCLGKRVCVYKPAPLHASELLVAGVIDRTMMSEDWARKEFNIQFSCFHEKRSEGLVLFFLIALSLAHMANEQIQSMARPSRSGGTAFTTGVKSKVPSVQSDSNEGTLNASASRVDLNDLPAKGLS